MQSIVKTMARNNIFANLLMTIILVGGVFGIASMNREFFPNMSVDIVQSMGFPL